MTLSRFAAVTGVCLLAACDLPTDTPIIDQEWVVPIKTATISVAQFLPVNVFVNGTRFQVNVPNFSVSRSVAQVCPVCIPGAPAPAFTSTFSASQNLPANVSGGDIGSATVNLSVQNGFSFDPTANGGSVTVTVTDGQGGRELGRLTFTSGQLPANTTTTRTLTLATGNVGGVVTETAVIDSKGGQLTPINTNQQLTVTASTQSLLVNSARINVAGKAINIDQLNLDVSDIDTGVTDKIQEGSVIFDVTNPFGVGLNSSVRINYPNGTLVRTITVTNAATQTIKLTYAKGELLSFLGKDPVTLTGTGNVAAGAGVITVTPTQTVQLKAKLDVKIQLGT